jgi:calnexin
MQKDILFDNIYIGHSVEDAEKLKAETFDIKRPVEEKEEEANKPKPPTDSGAATVSLKEDPVEYIKQKVNAFVTIAKTSPVDAVKQVPEVAGAAGVLLATILAIALGGAGASSPQVQAKAKEAADKAKNAKDKAVDAAATGVDKAAAEVNKRTTRSAAS